jgi:hypothetical protein
MAALASYTALVAALADWLVRGDQTSRIPTYIGLAEAQWGGLRLRQMVKRSTAAISDEYSALPTDFLAEDTVTLDGVKLIPAPAAVLAGAGVPAAGKPVYYAIVGDEIRYFPAPDTAYTAELTYYARVPALTVDAPTNWVLAEAPDLYLYGALIQAAPYLFDSDAANTWANLYTAALSRLKTAQRTKVGPLRTEVATMLPHHSFDINTGL